MRYDHAISVAERICRPAPRTLSDEALVASIAAGDKSAMQTLFSRHSARVFRFLLRIVDNAATAEDLVSETFIEIWRQAGRFEGRSKASTWLLGVARHKALSSLRQRRFDQLDEGTVALVPDPSDTPEVEVQRKSSAAVLRECLQQLPPAQRELLDLIYYHEQSIADVAQLLGVPENTVKTRAFYARKRLAELMAARGVERAAL
ncbi:MAG TPA: sigma-70 family RNA polymerase sigma factor [Xanthobacteraceae bacterium]|nr:sigma-70 family RNA polymerase sigma factor [Xanthobacteraceae bacterium]